MAIETMVAETTPAKSPKIKKPKKDGKTSKEERKKRKAEAAAASSPAGEEARACKSLSISRLYLRWCSGTLDEQLSNLRRGAPSIDCDWMQPSVARGAALINVHPTF